MALEVKHYQTGLRHSISGFSLLVGLGLCVGVAQAAPVGGDVVAGTASISAAGNKTTIHQQSNRAVIDWRKFDIGKGEHTHFAQPGGMR